MAQLTVARGGKALLEIVFSAEASPTERYGAEELARWLGEASGAPFTVRALRAGEPAPAKGILLRHDPALGNEEFRWRVGAERVEVAGGRPRGLLYGVYRLLFELVGIRWWAPWATDVPKKPTLALTQGERQEKPAFESRDPFWYPAFDGDWAARNHSNSASARLTEKHGGKIIYKGFVHTFFPLIPPEEHFEKHPEWYSLLKNKRTVQGAQLCTTNPQLREKVVERVRAWLKEAPEATIISISQNDWYGPCECDNCRALDDAEGGHIGSVLTLVNFVAERLEREFPNIAFDTLAYQYTRKAPKTVRPRPSVIVRLCSIECNFGEPLEAPVNKSFGDDLRAWSQKSQRLYIWDYTTNFAHYCLPHPNWFALGANVRFFHNHGVKGLFEQGAYQSQSSEFSELRAWVLARLLWDPKLDDRKLITEFLNGYYGKRSAPFIARYMELLHNRSRGWNLTCYSAPNASFLSFDTLAEADALWKRAEDAAPNATLRWRVAQGRNCVRYAVLAAWSRLKKEGKAANKPWPFGTASTLAKTWLETATSKTGAPAAWEPMKLINEGGTTPQAFAARFTESAEDTTPLPTDLTGVEPKTAVRIAESAASLYQEGTLSAFKPDPLASDKRAAWMPGTHSEWAIQFPFSRLPEKVNEGRWKVWAVVRVEKGSASSGNAFSAGVYDSAAKTSRNELQIPVAGLPDGYKTYLLGTVEGHSELYVWLAPVPGSGVNAIWVDRLILTPA